MSDRKNSIIRGGLAGTAGIFVTKAIGILYVSPFYALATESNAAYYGYAYDIYNVLLNLTISGIPFAVAVLVSRYMVKKDYRTVLATKRISLAVMAVIGFVSMVIIFFMAGPLSRVILTSNASADSLAKTRNVLMIISLALFTVPILGAYRGYYQGLKNFNLYSISNVFEQIARVLFLLGMGFLAIYIFGMDRMWAVYFAVLSTSVSALLALIQLIFFNHRHRDIETLAQQQPAEPIRWRLLIREMLLIAMPYLITSLLNNTVNIANLLFFNRSMMSVGFSEATSQLYYSMISVSTSKLVGIPQVLSAGFSIAVIPIITADMENKTLRLLRQHIRDCLETVLYIIVPTVFIMYFLSDRIYLMFYGSGLYTMGGSVLRTQMIFGFLTTLSTTLMAIMMAIGQRYAMVIVLGLGAVAEFTLISPLIQMFGFRGSIFASFISASIVWIVGLILMIQKTRINFIPTLRRFFKMVMAMLVMLAVYWILDFTPLGQISMSRVVTMLQCLFYGGIGVVVYFVVTYKFKVFQSIFRLKLNLPTHPSKHQ